MADDKADNTNISTKGNGDDLASSGIAITPQRTGRLRGASLAPASEKKSGTATSSGDLPRIRTYAADMNDAIKKRGATLSSIVSAEKDSEKKAPPPTSRKEQRRTLLIGFISFVLVLIGGGAVTVTMFLDQRAVEEEIRTSSIISPNHILRVQLEGGRPLAESLGETRRDASISLGEIVRIDITNLGSLASPNEILTALGVPEVLRREVTDVMVGVHAFDRNQPFIILSVSAYDRSFNALLTWESEMARAFGSFFAPIGAQGLPPILSFSDGILQNIDVRRSQSAWPIIYGYPSRQVLIITTNEFTLREILSRFASMRP